MEYSSATDVGKVRQHNEDAVAVVKSGEYVLAVVADGMGGHRAGDTASRLACETLVTGFYDLKESLARDEITAWLEKAASEANSNIFEYQKIHPECRGMGTTLTAALSTVDFTAYANAGDSRLYISAADGLQQVTEDHSLVEELVKRGEISVEEAEKHPQKHVLTRALGTEKTIMVDTGIVEWQEKDTILLCSDGLTNKLPDKEIEEVLQKFPIVDIPVLLIDKANERGGEDNITAAAVRNREVGI
ncbi:MAG: Stp1/IreP family PP2C-type Ser/Thr phosphatase [Alkalicoccus sp.]|nr:MAG: Stp1/IreP family PP2C-type Ser/Thr phosphatase [Alkalicoccus sp.]